MTDRPGFRLPEGVQLDLAGDRLHISYHGDIELDQDLGRVLGTIRAGGDLTVKLPRVTGDLSAGGTLRIQGPVDAGTLHGREVVLGRQTVRCRAISADRSITIGAAHLTVDVIIAPEILLDPKADGRVTVIESANERGPTKIKGGFSLVDFEEAFGNSVQYLAERGVKPIPGRELSGDTPGGAVTEAIERLPRSVPTEQITELHRRLTDAVGRIAACYDEHDRPEQIAQLRTLVDRQDYATLRDGIAEVWNGVLGFHKARGIRPHHQVTYAFNVIHGLTAR